MMRFWVVAIGFAFMAGNAVSDSKAQSHRKVSPTKASICGNPMIACKTTAAFQPNDLPFQVAKDAVIIDTVPFYAIILRSVVANPAGCDDFIPENDRLAAQALFPDHKVFSSRCADPENSRYEDITRVRYKFSVHPSNSGGLRRRVPGRGKTVSGKGEGHRKICGRESATDAQWLQWYMSKTDIAVCGGQFYGR